MSEKPKVCVACDCVDVVEKGQQIFVEGALHGAQIPLLVGSGTVGLAVFLFGIPLAPLLAAGLARAQLQNVERSTVRLKKNRASLQKKERSRDDFIVH